MSLTYAEINTKRSVESNLEPEDLLPLLSVPSARPPIVELSAGPAASEPALTSVIREKKSAGSADFVWEHGQADSLVVAIDPAEERWQRLKRRYFPPEGRQERIKAALKALEEAVVYYDLDADTMRWIVEEADEEDF
jgi:hypothetical protein